MTAFGAFGELGEITSFAQAQEMLAEMAFAMMAPEPGSLASERDGHAEEELRSRIGEATEGVVLLDDEGIVCALDATAQQIFEVAAADAIGRDASNLFTTTSDAMPALTFSTSPGGTHKRLTLAPSIVGRRRGAAVALDIRVAELAAFGRRLFSLHIADLLAKRRAEEPIRRADARYRALVEQIPAVTFMAALDDGENEMYVSPQIEALLGFSQREWLDDPILWFKRLHPDDQEMWTHEFSRGIAAGGPFRAECRVLARDGHVVWIHGEARVVRDDRGRPVLLQGIAFDITESKRAAQQIREAHEAKVRNERLAAVGRLAASIGHDIRNPLAAVRNALHYVRKRIATTELERDARVTQFVGIMDRELDVCTNIVGDLLDYARERPPALAACPLAPLVADAISVVPAPAHVTIENAVPETLPVPDLDRDQFRQVLMNLIQNAAEAIPEDRAGLVRVSAIAGEDDIALSIADNGAGIPEGDLDKIFEPLFTSKVKGTGLGLAIVANTVERHGGSIDVQTRKGRGTTFTLRLTRKRGGRA